MSDIRPTGDPNDDAVAAREAMDELFLNLPADATLAIEMTQLTQAYDVGGGKTQIPSEVLASYLLKAVAVLDVEVSRLKARVEALEKKVIDQ